VEFATAAGAFKHTIEGDVNLASADEIEALVKGENVGKLLR
jgi:2-dehydro-3-deoxygluconokinase